MKDKDIGLLPYLWLKTELKKKNGEVYTVEREGHSWTLNSYNHLLCSLLTVQGDGSGYTYGELNSKKTNAAIESIYFTGATTENSTVGSLVGYYVGTGNSNQGILVGTGSAAFAITDYVLAAPIVSGNSAGKLHYGNMGLTVPEAVWDGVALTWTQTYERYFNNNSGGTINVAEIGMVGLASGVRYFLDVRDVLDTPIPVADTDQLRVAYTITQTLPE